MAHKFSLGLVSNSAMSLLNQKGNNEIISDNTERSLKKVDRSTRTISKIASSVVSITTSIFIIGFFIWLVSYAFAEFGKYYPKLACDAFDILHKTLGKSFIGRMLGDKSHMPVENLLPECKIDMLEEKFPRFRKELRRMVRKGEAIRPYSMELYSRQLMIPFKLYDEYIDKNLAACPKFSRVFDLVGEESASCFLTIIPPGSQAKHRDKFSGLLRYTIPFYIQKSELKYKVSSLGTRKTEATPRDLMGERFKKTPLKEAEIYSDSDSDCEEDEDQKESLATISYQKVEGEREKKEKLVEGKSVLYDPTSGYLISNQTPQVCVLLQIDIKKDFGSKLSNFFSNYALTVIRESDLSIETRNYFNLELNNIPKDIPLNFNSMKERGLLRSEYNPLARLGFNSLSTKLESLGGISTTIIPKIEADITSTGAASSTSQATQATQSVQSLQTLQTSQSGQPPHNYSSKLFSHIDKFAKDIEDNSEKYISASMEILRESINTGDLKGGDLISGLASAYSQSNSQSLSQVEIEEINSEDSDDDYFERNVVKPSKRSKRTRKFNRGL